MTAKLFTTPQAVRIDSTGTPYAGAKANFYETGTTTPADTYEDAALNTAHSNPVVADSAGQFPAIYLDPDVSYRCIITESDDTQIDDIDPVWLPVKAANVTFADAQGYWVFDDVESVLNEIGANYAQSSGTNTWSQRQTHNADIWMNDNVIQRAELQDFSVTHSAVTSSSGTITLNMTQANSFYHLLTENLTTISITNPPASGSYGQVTLFLQQDAGGGAYTVDFDSTGISGVVWPSGNDPTMSSGNDAIDMVTFATYDGGTTWFANISQAYPG